jgi:Aldo/keto reductase family
VDEIPEVALRYVLSHLAVSTVIPGMRCVRNVERNMSVANGEGLTKEQIQRLKAHRWARNFYPQPAERERGHGRDLNRRALPQPPGVVTSLP